MKLTRTHVIMASVATVLFCTILGLVTSNALKPGRLRSTLPGISSDERLPDTGEGWYRQPGPQPVFTFDGPFPEMPDKLPIYQVLPPPNDVNEASLRRLAEDLFGLPPDATFYAPDLICTVIGPDKRLRYTRRTGALTMSTSAWANSDDHDPNDFPTKNEALKIATDYLTSRRLLPSDADEPFAVDHIRDSGFIVVAWGRRIAGYSTWGPGGEITIHIGPRGEIIHFSKRWLEYRPWKTAPLITPQQAFSTLNSGSDVFISSKGGRVRKIELMYHCRPEQVFIQPVYYFWIADGKGYAAVPAVDPQYIQPPADADYSHDPNAA